MRACERDVGDHWYVMWSVSVRCGRFSGMVWDVLECYCVECGTAKRMWGFQVGSAWGNEQSSIMYDIAKSIIGLRMN